MSRYLEESAAHLRKAAEYAEQTGYWEHSRKPQPELIATRERIAKAFTDLAAIDKGLLPTDLAREILDRAARLNGGAL